MKRLFKVNGEFFDDKMKAKAARGRGLAVQNDQGKVVRNTYPHTVELGPDHDDYQHTTRTPGHQRTKQTVKGKKG